MAGVPVPEAKREPGFRELDPACVLRVTDVRGRVIDEFLGPTTKRLLSAQVTHQLTSVLSDNAARTPAFGAVNNLALSRPVAAKTGTTNDFTDGWTMGYNPQVAIGVWVGNADRSPMNGLWGVTGASPIWRDLMEYCFDKLPPADFVEPAGMKWVEVDPETGALPKGGKKTRDIFVEGMEPVSPDKTRMQVPLCNASGKLATQYCPESEIRVHDYELYPTANGSWVRSMRGHQPPSAYCNQHGPNARPTPTVAPTQVPE
jgi:membrane carboxypeptidase/penicillin-binding protein